MSTSNQPPLTVENLDWTVENLEAFLHTVGELFDFLVDFRAGFADPSVDVCRREFRNCVNAFYRSCDVVLFFCDIDTQFPWGETSVRDLDLTDLDVSVQRYLDARPAALTYDDIATWIQRADRCLDADAFLRYSLEDFGLVTWQDFDFLSRTFQTYERIRFNEYTGFIVTAEDYRILEMIRRYLVAFARNFDLAFEDDVPPVKTT